MKLGHYRNEIIEAPFSIPIAEWNGQIKTHILYETEFREGLSSQGWELDLRKFILNGAGREYPVAAGKDGMTPAGIFVIAEKWENPYKKRNEMLYTPSHANPIGGYLVILANPDSGK